MCREIEIERVCREGKRDRERERECVCVCRERDRESVYV